MSETCPGSRDRSFFFRVFDAVETDPKLRPLLRWFVVELAKHSDADGYGYWGQDKLRKTVGCSRRQLVRLFSEGVEAGWVVVRRRSAGAFVPGREPNEYWVVIPEGANQSRSGESANQSRSAKTRKKPESASPSPSVQEALPKVPGMSPEGARNAPEGANQSPDLPLGSTFQDLPRIASEGSDAPSDDDRKFGLSSPEPASVSTSKPNRKPRKASKPTAKPKKAPKRKGPERTPEQRAAHAQVMATYCEAFEQARGAKPIIDGADGTAVYRLLDKVGADAERACAVVRNALAPGAWPADATIRTIASDPSRYVAPPQPAKAGRGPVQRDYGANPYFSLTAEAES